MQNKVNLKVNQHQTTKKKYTHKKIYICEQFAYIDTVWLMHAHVKTKKGDDCEWEIEMGEVKEEKTKMSIHIYKGHSKTTDEEPNLVNKMRAKLYKT